MKQLFLKAIRKELFIESVLFTAILLLAFYWSNNAQSIQGRFVSAVKVVIVCVVPPYLIVHRIVTPRYLLKKRYKMFALWVCCIMLLNPVSTYMAGRLLNHIFLGGSNNHNTDVIARSLYIFFWNTLLSVSVATGLRLLKFYNYTEKRILQLEKQHLEAELHFLQSQINPHFIFNVMNTIYFQIHESNQEARLTVENFSTLMRYQLEISERLQVDINKEVLYIKNYCEIQQLRLESNTVMNMCFGANLSGFKVAPFLMLPLIENAFKYISRFKPPQKNELSLSMTWDEAENTLNVTVENTVDNDRPNDLAKKEMTGSGLGLVNLQKRLALIYPHRHSFTVKRTQGKFSASFSIRLNSINPA